MKTINQIKQLVENIAIDSQKGPVKSSGGQTKKIGEEYIELGDAIRDKYLPLFQFNIEVTSSDSAQAVFNQISENTIRKSSVAYLPDGQHTFDKVGNMVLETPTIMEWQGGKAGQNYVINYTNKTAEKA